MLQFEPAPPLRQPQLLTRSPPHHCTTASHSVKRTGHQFPHHLSILQPLLPHYICTSTSTTPPFRFSFAVFTYSQSSSVFLPCFCIRACNLRQTTVSHLFTFFPFQPASPLCRFSPTKKGLLQTQSLSRGRPLCNFGHSSNQSFLSIDRPP